MEPLTVRKLVVQSNFWVLATLRDLAFDNRKNFYSLAEGKKKTAKQRQLEE